MELIYQDDEIKFQYFVEQKLLVQHWNGYIHDENYKEAHDNLMKLVEKYHVVKLISVTYDKFHVTPDVLSWTEKVPLTKLVEYGLKYIAFVMSSHQIAKLAIKQVEEENTSPVIIKIFHFYTEAIKWIEEQSI
jgi:hypothetical protein